MEEQKNKEEDKMPSVNSKDELIQQIQNVIKNNGNHEITGNVLQEVLVLMVNSLATDGVKNTIPVCAGTGRAKGNDGLQYDDTLYVKGNVNIASGGITCDKDVNATGRILSKENIQTDKNLEALGDLNLGTKGMPSSIYISDKSNPSIRYRIYVSNGSFVIEQS